MDTEFVLHVCAEWIARITLQVRGNRVRLLDDTADKRLPGQFLRRKKNLQAPFVEAVDLTPRRVWFAAGVAGGFAAAKILSIGDPNYGDSPLHAGNFPACRIEHRWRNVFEDLCTKHDVECGVGKFKPGGITLDRLDTRMVEARTFEVERNDFVEALRQSLRQKAIAGPNV